MLVPDILLIMALAALDATHFGFGNFLAALDAVVNSLHFLVVAVIFVSDACTLVALDTPFHRQRRILVNFFHSLNRAVAGLAL